MPRPKTPTVKAQPHVAIIGAGIAGITCARTLAQAGMRVTVFEKSRGCGGRMSTRRSPFGDFDHGAQYFTMRDPRFEAALATTAQTIKRWSANTVRVMDANGQVLATTGNPSDAHWVPVPGMNALVKAWAAPLQDGTLKGCNVVSQTRIVKLRQHGQQWALEAEVTDPSSGVTDTQTVGNFDHVVLAIPSAQAHALLASSNEKPDWQSRIADVLVDPCWTLMLAYPQANQPIGPHWNVARSIHHRVSWVARESSKPGRSTVERWTVQASPQWSQEHVNDAPDRVIAKLTKAFGEITGIRVTPSHAEVHRWLYAQTRRPLGQPFLSDTTRQLSVCGDWCLGNRVENGFVSGLELALAIAQHQD